MFAVVRKMQNNKKLKTKGNSLIIIVNIPNIEY